MPWCSWIRFITTPPYSKFMFYFYRQGNDDNQHYAVIWHVQRVILAEHEVVLQSVEASYCKRKSINWNRSWNKQIRVRGNCSFATSICLKKVHELLKTLKSLKEQSKFWSAPTNLQRSAYTWSNSTAVRRELMSRTG